MKIFNLIKAELIKLNIKKFILTLTIINFIYYSITFIISYSNDINWFNTLSPKSFSDFFNTHFIIQILFYCIIYFLYLAINTIKFEFKNNYQEQNIIFGVNYADLFIAKTFHLFFLLYIMIFINSISILLVSAIANIFYEIPYEFENLFKNKETVIVFLSPILLISSISFTMLITYFFNKVSNMIILLISIGLHIYSFYLFSFKFDLFSTTDFAYIKLLPFTFFFNSLAQVKIDEFIYTEMVKLISFSIAEVCLFYFVIYFLEKNQFRIFKNKE